ncbi:MAG: radical SAM protein [candidate division WOR-3 bacterium]
MNLLLKNEMVKVSKVLVFETEDKKFIESVDVEPVISGKNHEKWVLIVSTQVGCPVRCVFCDSGYEFARNLTFDEMMYQIDFMINERNLNPNRFKKFKVQFARMGEPSFNDDVLEVIKELKKKYKNCIPCISTVFPKNRRKWFEKLLSIRENFVDFQLQFSIYSTNTNERDKTIPIEKENFVFLNEYGKEFYSPGKRKIVLNFPVSESNEISFEKIALYFDKKTFIIKLTPVNPTYQSIKNNLCVDSYKRMEDIKKQLNKNGFDVIVSIGELKENIVGSNCGQSSLKFSLDFKKIF